MSPNRPAVCTLMGSEATIDAAIHSLIKEQESIRWAAKQEQRNQK